MLFKYEVHFKEV